MTARHILLESSAMGRNVHLWSFGVVGQPVIVFPSNAGVAHEWDQSGMVEALGPWLAAGKIKLYCVESNVSRSFSGDGHVDQRMRHHAAYERFVLDDLVPYIRRDCRSPQVKMVASGCSVGALYTSLFVLKHPETFARGLCLSGRYRASHFTGGQSNDDLYFNDPLAFLPNLHGGPLEHVRRQAHLTLVVGRGRFEGDCLPETLELGGLLHQKRIPNHVAVWGDDSIHDYGWWKKQVRHYLPQLI